MSVSLGAFIVQYRLPFRRPRSHDEAITDPTWDPSTKPPDPSTPVLEALYDGAVRRTDMTAHVHAAADRGAERSAVAFDGRCVVVFDFWRALGCNFEAVGSVGGLDAALEALSARPDVERVMVVLLDGVGDSYGLLTFVDGVRVRRWTFAWAEPAPLRLDEGAALPTEPTAETTHAVRRIDDASRTLLGDRGVLGLSYEHEGPVFLCE